MNLPSHLSTLRRNKAAMKRSMAAFVLSLAFIFLLSGSVESAPRMVLGELFTNTS